MIVELRVMLMLCSTHSVHTHYFDYGYSRTFKSSSVNCTLFFYLYQTLIYPSKIPHFSEFSSAFLTILRVSIFNNSAISVFYFSLN